MSTPNSVRLALPAEAVDIVRLQRQSWAKDPVTAAALDDVDPQDMARAWYDSIMKPPLAHFRVLVAIDEEQRITGFSAIGPSPDEDAEATAGTITEFVVDGEDHASRLINAVVDTLRRDGYETATIWLRSTDDQMRSFLQSCGWEADGAHQEIGISETGPTLKRIRLHTDIRVDD